MRTTHKDVDDGIADLERLLREDPVPFSEAEEMDQT